MLELIKMQKEMHEDIKARATELKEKDAVIEEKEKENARLKAELAKSKSKQQACCTVF